MNNLFMYFRCWYIWNCYIGINIIFYYKRVIRNPLRCFKELRRSFVKYLRPKNSDWSPKVFRPLQSRENKIMVEIKTVVVIPARPWWALALYCRYEIISLDREQKKWNLLRRQVSFFSEIACSSRFSDASSGVFLFFSNCENVQPTQYFSEIIPSLSKPQKVLRDCVCFSLHSFGFCHPWIPISITCIFLSLRDVQEVRNMSTFSCFLASVSYRPGRPISTICWSWTSAATSPPSILSTRQPPKNSLWRRHWRAWRRLGSRSVSFSCLLLFFFYFVPISDIRK